jgi:hypothetical protein
MRQAIAVRFLANAEATSLYRANRSCSTGNYRDFGEESEQLGNMHHCTYYTATSRRNTVVAAAVVSHSYHGTTTRGIWRKVGVVAKVNDRALRVASMS